MSFAPPVEYAPAPAMPEPPTPVWDPEVSRYPWGSDGPPLFADLAAVTAEGYEEPEPDVLQRDDGICLFYRGYVNALVGDAESGKTWVALAAVAEELTRGGRAVYVDADHNGAAALAARLDRMGVPRDVITDPRRLLVCEPEDRDYVTMLARACQSFNPGVAVLDSVGEIAPMWGGSSNSPDDYTLVNREAFKVFARPECAVVLIDHTPKNTETAKLGATGTNAKRRSISGVNIMVSLGDSAPFTPGQGGTAVLAISKDRHGSLRKHCPTAGDRQPLAGRFVMREDEAGRITWTVYAPADGEHNPAEAPDPALVEQATSWDDLDTVTWKLARERLKCKSSAVGPVLKAARDSRRNLSAHVLDQPQPQPRARSTPHPRRATGKQRT